MCKSHNSKPMHILKVLIEYYKLKKIPLKNIQVEPNDFMAEFATFTTKMQKILRTAYPI